MPIARLLSRSDLEIGLAYLAGYVLLDWLSYVHPIASFGITPWNPPTGLSFALILLFGVELLPWLLLSPLLADVLVRGLPLPIWVQFASGLVIGVGYCCATFVLLHPRLQFDVTLGSKRSLLLLVIVAVLAAALVALSYVGLLTLLGFLPPDDLVRAVVRFWVGDVIGITVLTPFLLIVFTRRLPQPTWEMAALVVVIAAVLFAVFGLAPALRFQLFYLFFIPVIWSAVRFGLEGVTAGLVMTQLGLIAAIQNTAQSAADVTAYQALMVGLSVTGLAFGVLVSEQQRFQQQLRLNQEALDRVSRLATMGEFAAALAHEINQPLTAIANYARLAKRAADSEPPDVAAASTAAGRAVEQVERAAEVTRRIRDFVRLGSCRASETSVRQLVEHASKYCLAELQGHGGVLETSVGRDLPPVAVDALQIEQVIVNLVRNAAEALSDAGRIDGRIVIEAQRDPGGGIRVHVRDNGPGFDPDVLHTAMAPFTTTKTAGMGLGLSLARSVIEAHGGRLEIDSGTRGATVSFTLPVSPPRTGSRATCT
jgi:signal transduction histidine kinase